MRCHRLALGAQPTEVAPTAGGPRVRLEHLLRIGSTSHSVGCGHDVDRGLLGSSELLPQGLVGVLEAENLTRRNVMQFHLTARLVQGALGSNRIQGKSKR